MQCGCCCQYAPHQIPLFLNSYISQPLRTRIYFPDSRIGNSCVSFEKGEGTLLTDGSSLLHWFPSRVNPPNQQLRIGNEVPFQFGTTSDRRDGSQKAMNGSFRPVAESQCATNLPVPGLSEGRRTVESAIGAGHTLRTGEVNGAARYTQCPVSSSNNTQALTAIKQEKETSPEPIERTTISCGPAESHEVERTRQEVTSIKKKKPKIKRKRVRDKEPSRRINRANAWNGPSYSELITNAIMSTEERKMIVAEIYDWIIQNVPYFNERKHCESSQGWKNAVRHTLSLRRRFVRLPRANTTTPWYNSWWTVSDKHFEHKKRGPKPKHTLDEEQCA